MAALHALDKAKITAGQSVFINGSLGGVGRAAAQLALMRGAAVGGSCRDTATAQATRLGIDPVVGFDFDPAPLAGRFDLVFDTAGTLSGKTARTLLKPGGHVIDIIPTPAKFLRSLTSRKFKVLMTKMKPVDLDKLGRAAAEGKLNIAIARTVPLADAVQALTELKEKQTPKGGKLVITP